MVDGTARGLNRRDFLNAAYDDVTTADVLAIVDEHICTGKCGYMVSLNVDACVKLDKNPSFRDSFFGADLILMDSQPLTKIARSKGLSVQEKISGSDLMPVVCSHAAKRRYSCFILGGMPGVPERAADNLSAKNDGLIIVGTLSPDFGFERNPEKVCAVVEEIREAAPDILFVCMGMPKSELFIAQHLEDLHTHFAFSVGAAVDFEAGNARRAPEWVQRAGFEWLYRFSREPRRLFKRYFVDSWRLLSIALRRG